MTGAAATVVVSTAAVTTGGAGGTVAGGAGGTGAGGATTSDRIGKGIIKFRAKIIHFNFVQYP